jgi:polyketide biosynthesis enoyl-CoA hydratase PksH
MAYERIVLEEGQSMLRIVLARPDRGNSIDDALLRDLHLALDCAEATPSCRVVVLEGKDGVFCTGLDFEATVSAPASESAVRRGESYFSLLRRFSSLPLVIISAIDGRVAAGGVGLAAASDYVFATPRATFSLPEALWGLLPCCVLPFLLRRVGFQKAYTMTLSTQPATAAQAAECQLVDELTDDLAGQVKKLAMRVQRLQPSTLAAAKRYFGQLAGISPEVERVALAEFDRLMSSSTVRRNIENFVTTRRFPWEMGSV